LLRRPRRLLSTPSSLPTLINSERSSCIFMENFFLFLIAPSSSSAYTLGQESAGLSGRALQGPSVFPLISLFFLYFEAVVLV
jgi:hypothetical protein